MTKLPVLNTLWVQGKLSYLERVCLGSARDVGHKVVLYTYFGVENVPDGIEVRDGREVMPESRLMKHKKRNSWSLCADIFRYFLMQHEHGYWIDTDVYFLKPIVTERKYIFGWQNEDLINNAILYLERDSELITELLNFIDLPHIIPPWLTRRQKLRYQIRPILGLRPLTLAEHRWGVIGPRAITHFAKELQLTDYALPQDLFYPLPPKRAKDAFNPDIDITSYITDRTLTVHLWNEGVKSLKSAPAPKGCYIEQICTRHGIAADG